MNWKKFWLATGAYTVVTFAIAYFWHIVLFYDIYLNLGVFTRWQDPVLALGFAATLVQGLLFAYLYPRFVTAKNPFAEGLVFTYCIGAFMASIAIIAHAAKMYVSSLPTWFLVEFSFYFIHFTAIGLLFTWIYGDDPAI